MLTGPEKIQVVQRYAREAGYHDEGIYSRFRYFIETGTAHGPTTAAMVDYNDFTQQFERIITIDLAQDNYDNALVRFAGEKEVLPVYGDSSIVLPYILDAIVTPALFWLDAHHEHDDRPVGVDGETPIWRELEHIFARGKTNMVLVDDARLFGTGGYPTLDAVKAYAEQHNYEYKLEDDIIRMEHRDNQR